MICVSASAIVWGWERATGRGGGCGRCPRGRPRLGSGGCRRRRGLGGCQGGRVVSRVCGAAAGCRLRGQILILLSPRCPCLLLPANRRVDHPGRLRVCLCVGGDPWGRGGHCHTCPGGGARTASGYPPRGGDSGAMARPQGRGPRGPGGCDLQPPRGGAAARRSALCCLGLRASPSPSSRPECQTGGGDEPTTTPSRFPWKPRSEDAAPPPRSGTRRTPGALGADSPGLSSSSPSPRTHTSAPRPARVWRAVESAQARGLGSPPSSGRPRVPNGSQSQGYAGMAGGGVVDQVRLPRIHLGAGESPREGMREPRFPEPPF